MRCSAERLYLTCVVHHLIHRRAAVPLFARRETAPPFVRYADIFPRLTGEIDLEGKAKSALTNKRAEAIASALFYILYKRQYALSTACNSRRVSISVTSSMAHSAIST